MQALDEEKKSNMRAMQRSLCMIAHIPTFLSWSHLDVDDLDMSAPHMDCLIQDLLTAPMIPQIFPAEQIKAVHTSISSFSSFIPKFQSTLCVGIKQLFNQLLWPKLHTLLADVYKDISYVLDKTAYAVVEYQDIVQKRFIRAWEGLAEGYKVQP